MTMQRMSKRAKLIRLIHIAKLQLGMIDSDYRALLEGVSGKRSSADMTVWELEKILKAIKYLGFSVKKLPVKEADRGFATEEQLKYIKGLWELASRNKTEQSLHWFCKRIAGVDHLRFLSVKGAQKVILAVRALAANAGYNPDSIRRS